MVSKFSTNISEKMIGQICYVNLKQVKNSLIKKTELLLRIPARMTYWCLPIGTTIYHKDTHNIEKSKYLSLLDQNEFSCKKNVYPGPFPFYCGTPQGYLKFFLGSGAGTIRSILKKSTRGDVQTVKPVKCIFF